MISNNITNARREAVQAAQKEARLKDMKVLVMISLRQAERAGR